MNKLSKTKKTNKQINKKIYLHYFEPKIKIDGFEFVNISKIDKLKNNTYEEIIIQDVLEYHSDNNAAVILHQIVSKLKKDGVLHIQGLDAKAICYGIVYSQIDIATFKMLVFGSGDKRNIYTLNQMKNMITNDLSNNIRINKIKFLNGIQFYIECIKI